MINYVRMEQRYIDLYKKFAQNIGTSYGCPMLAESICSGLDALIEAINTEDIASTSKYINLVTEYLINLLNKNKQVLTGMLAELFNGSKKAINIGIHPEKVIGLPTELLRQLPKSIIIRITVGNEDKAVAEAVISGTKSADILLYIGYHYSVSDIMDAIPHCIPHELRHIFDAFNPRQTDIMKASMLANAGDEDAYSNDDAELNARLSAVVSNGYNLLKDPDIREHIHTPEDVISELQDTLSYQYLMDASSPDQIEEIYDYLVDIFSKIMEKVAC